MIRFGWRRTAGRPLEELTECEREALALTAEGHSNEGIGECLVLSPRTVETHIRQIFLKLGLRDAPAYRRRVVDSPCEVTPGSLLSPCQGFARG
jgi:DNA-binding NarL/FixJ family response regulator